MCEKCLKESHKILIVSCAINKKISIKFQLLCLSLEHESKTLRINEVHELVHQLPEENFNILELLIEHLKK